MQDNRRDLTEKTRYQLNAEEREARITLYSERAALGLCIFEDTPLEEIQQAID